MIVTTQGFLKFVPERLRAQRERLGFSRAALAEDAGCTVQTIVNVETGRHLPNVVTFFRLCQSLCLCMDEVLLGEGGE